MSARNRGNCVSRILLVSPEQSELIRRNRSRIFIWPAGEGVIDSLIFQASRPLENFLDDARRAISLAGLEGDASILAVENATNSVGMQQHIVTGGWLTMTEGDKNIAYDVIVELDIANEELAEPNMQTFNATLDPEFPLENPIVIRTGVESFTAEYNNEAAGQEDNVVDIAQQSERIAARQEQEDDSGQTEENPSGRMAGRPGRVKNPLLDGRLKQNRMPRKPQDDDNSSRAGSRG